MKHILRYNGMLINRALSANLESVYTILAFESESYRLVFHCGAVYYAVQGGSNF